MPEKIIRTVQDLKRSFSMDKYWENQLKWKIGLKNSISKQKTQWKASTAEHVKQNLEYLDLNIEQRNCSTNKKTHKL